MLFLFLPGYALINVVDRKHELGLLLKVLLAYILSMFVSGPVGYITASLGFAVSDMIIPFILKFIWH